MISEELTESLFLEKSAKFKPFVEEYKRAKNNTGRSF